MYYKDSIKKNQWSVDKPNDKKKGKSKCDQTYLQNRNWSDWLRIYVKTGLISRFWNLIRLLICIYMVLLL